MAEENRNTEAEGDGVRYARCPWGDCYSGTKQALIVAGAAKLEWWPTAPQFDKYGRTRRTFHIDGPHGVIDLMQYGPDRWELRIPVHVEEQRRREAEFAEERRRRDLIASGRVDVLNARRTAAAKDPHFYRFMARVLEKPKRAPRRST